MATRLFVERGLALQAVVSRPDLRIVSPQFTKAQVTISKPSYATVPSYRLIQTSTGYRDLVTLANYLRPFMRDVVLDPDTKNLYFRTPADNQVVLAEEAVFSYLKAEVEELLIFEQAAFSVSKRHEETVALSESSTVTYAANKTENVAVTEERFAEINKPFEEPLAIAEVYSSLYGKAQADSVGLAEVIDVSITFIREFVESVPLTEAHSMDLGVNFEDAATVTEVTALSYSLNAAPEVVNVNEAFDRVVEFTRSFSDPVALLENIASSFSQSQQDTAAIEELLALQTEKPLPGEAISNVFDVYSSSYELNQTDSLGVSENLSRVVSYKRTFTDAFTLDDAAQIDAFALEAVINKSNVVAFADDLAYGYEKILGDSFGTSEESTKQLNKNTVESISFTDVSAFNISLAKTDLITVNEAQLFNLAKPLNESFSVVDQIASSFSPSKTDVVSLADSSSSATGKQLADSFGIFEALSIVRRSEASSVLNVGVLNFGPINN